MILKSILAVAALLSVTACSRSPVPGNDSDQVVDVTTPMASSDSADPVEVENVKLPPDTTPPPAAGNFRKETEVFHRKSPYFEVTLSFVGDFRPYPDVFAALYRDHHDTLDSELQTYGGSAGQTDDASTTVTLDAVSPRLLIASVTDFEFLGGSHGNYTPDIDIRDRATAKRLQPEDIFLPGSLPEADAYICKNFVLTYEPADPVEAGCETVFENRAFGGAISRDNKITGIVVDSFANYILEGCAAVPYRLFKSAVRPEWQDQFADDPDFEAHTQHRCDGR